MLADVARATLSRWKIVAFCTGASVLGGMVTASGMPPRYVARANVLMELVKPDPETGEIVPTKMLEDYVGTQMRLAASPATTRHMIEQFGWLNDPALQEDFRLTGRPMGEMTDWLAARLASAVSVAVPDETNLLEISYSAPDPDNAKLLVDSLRSAFLTEVIARKRESAQRSADSADRQAKVAYARYMAALDARNLYAARNGIALGQSSEQERRLAQALLGRGGRPAAITGGSGGDEEADEPASPGTAARSATSEGDERLTTLRQQAEIANRAYLAIIARRNQALRDVQTGDSNMSAFGEPTANDAPVFPDYKRIVIGSLFLGLILGGEVALLLELLHRRVRRSIDLSGAAECEVLATVRRRRRRFALTIPARLRRRRASGGKQVLSLR